MSWGIVASVGATVGSAIIGSKSASKAAKQQRKGTEAGVAELARQFDLQREDGEPYREKGAWALGVLGDELDEMPTHAEVMSDPGYQFGLREGERALARRRAAGGGRVSGAALREATRYATDYATTGYGATYQRSQDRMNRLASLAGLGQTATNASAAAGANAGNGIARLYGDQGDASAGATMAKANIWANTGNQLAALYRRPAAGTGSVGLPGVNQDDPYGIWGEG